MDMMEMRFRMMSIMGGGSMPSFGGNNLKYMIPIELTTPSTGKMEFYTGLKSPTEFAIGALFQPTMNDVDGYQHKASEFVFGMAFLRGQNTAGYVPGYNDFFAYSTAAGHRTGTCSTISTSPWSNFSNPSFIKHQSYDVSSASYLQNKVFKGFLLIFDTNYTGNAEQKALTDTGMSDYFSLTSPV